MKEKLKKLALDIAPTIWFVVFVLVLAFLHVYFVYFKNDFVSVLFGIVVWTVISVAVDILLLRYYSVNNL